MSEIRQERALDGASTTDVRLLARIRLFGKKFDERESEHFFGRPSLDALQLAMA
jgi:hypothetical protein